MTPKAERVLHYLQTAPDYTCGRQLNEQFGWRFGARIHELRQAGWPIVKRPCRCPACQRSKSRIYAWALVEDEAA